MLKEVMIVDDDTASLLICARLIRNERLALNATKCLNGKEAFDYLVRLLNEKQLLPELIFLDLNMPVMNGWDFMEAFALIRARMTPIPRIFILSSSPDPEDILKAKTYPDILEFISKPLSIATVKRMKEMYFPDLLPEHP